MSYRKELSFGLDIGDQSIKILQFHLQKNKPKIKSFAEITLPPGLVLNGEILQYEELSARLKSVLKQAKISAQHVVLALPEAKTFIKLFHISTNYATPLPKLIEDELVHHLPFELNEIWLDFKIIKKQTTTFSALVGAAPKKLVDSYIKLLNLSGLIPTIFDLESLAIARSLIKEGSAPICVLLADLGATKSTLIIANQDTVISTADGRSASNSLTENISEQLGIDLKSAQEMKHQYGLAGGADKYLAITQKYANNLAQRIKETINFTLAHNGSYPAVSEILLSGGGAMLKKLPETLSTILKIPVKIADPWVNTQYAANLKSQTEINPSFATACGLALTAIRQDHTG